MRLTLKAQDATKERRAAADGGETKETATEGPGFEMSATADRSPARRNSRAPRFVHLWSVAAGLCLCAAAVFWWSAQADAAFVAAALGVVAWFLNQRRQFKKARDEGEKFADVDGSERGRDVEEI